MIPMPLLFVARLFRIVVLSIAAGLAFPVLRLADRRSGPRVLRWYLQSCGASFVKLGQILAMRYDLLPPAYCEELGRLLDQVPPVAVAKIIAAIERDLGRSLDDSFAAFSRVPLAAASIAQIHTVTLHDGGEAIVKVKRPGIDRRFRIDFFCLRMLARLAEAAFVFSTIDLQTLVEELVSLTSEELDFRREARNLVELGEKMAEDEIDHCTPRIHPALCGANVVTMERFIGVPVNRLLAAVEGGDRAQLDAWAALGIKPRRVARTLMRSMLVQVVRHRLFHADPHAANLIVMQGGRLGWVDLGMLGWLDERTWLQQLRLRMAISQGRLDGAYQCLLATLEPLPAGDLSRFEVQIKARLRDWIVASSSASASLAEKSAGGFFYSAFGAMRRAGLRVPLDTFRLYRAMITCDAVILKLAPELDWIAVLRDALEVEKRRIAAQLPHQLTDLSGFGLTAQSLITLPALVADLAEYAARNRPWGRQSLRSSFDRDRELVFGWLRLVAIALAIALVVARLIAPFAPAAFAWAPQLAARIGVGWKALLGIAVLSSYVLGRWIRVLRSRE